MTLPTVKDRRGYVGGSEIASVLNLEPYGCARRLFYSKTNAAPDRLFVMNGAMEAGVALEDYVAQKAMDACGWTLRKRPGKRGAVDHEGVHIDRDIIGSDRKTTGIAEIKVIGEQAFFGWLRDGVPMGYLLQLQWGMHIWDRTWGAIIAWNRDAGGKPHVFEFDRDDVTISLVRTLVEAFWSAVEAGDIPSPLDERDGRCDRCEYRATCLESEWEQMEPGDESDVDIELAARAYDEAREIAKEADSLKESRRNYLVSIVGARGKVGRVSVTQSETWRLDVDALKRDRPEIAAAYQYRTVAQTLRVSKPKEQK
jgi:hypothetical protein